MSKNQYGRVRQVGIKNTYPNGYWDKITYWNGKLTMAIKEQNIREVDSIHRKLDYFIGREWDSNSNKLYGDQRGGGGI